jgi:hypothetical protein
MGVTAVDYEIDILNALDFEIALPCESKFHEEFGFEGVAEWVVDVVCECGMTTRYLLCQECLNTLVNAALGCPQCGKVDPGRECLRVIRHV